VACKRLRAITSSPANGFRRRAKSKTASWIQNFRNSIVDSETASWIQNFTRCAGQVATGAEVPAPSGPPTAVRG